MVNLLSPDARSERILAVWLALIAGYVDSYSLLAYGVYVSFMSGNTTQTGSLLGQEKWLAAVPTALAILSFVFGSIAGTWLAGSRLANPRKILFGMIAVVLAIIILGTQPHSATLPHWISIPLLGAAMGMMNATHSHVGAEPLSITFVTGTLNRLGTHIALALRHAPLKDAQGPSDTHLRRAGIAASVWTGFLSGTIISAVTSLQFGSWALLVPLLGLVTLIASRSR